MIHDDDGNAYLDLSLTPGQHKVMANMRRFTMLRCGRR